MFIIDDIYIHIYTHIFLNVGLTEIKKKLNVKEQKQTLWQ